MCICYISASIGKAIFTKIFLFVRHAVEKLGSGGMPPERVFETTPSKTLKNALFAK